MTRKTRPLPILAAAATLAALGGAALAQTQTPAQVPAEPMARAEGQEIQAFQQSALSLADVVAKAEAQGGGKAMSAEFDGPDDGDPAIWEVELVMPDGTLMLASVSPSDGSIAMMPTTGDDEGDDEDGDDD